MFIKLYSIAFVLFIAFDATWLGLVAKDFYAQQLGFLMKQPINWAAAVTFYFLFIAGLVVFVIAPAVERHSYIEALLYGGFFGLITYATYDLTNLATIKNWPVLVTIVDLVWGSVLAAAVSGLTCFIALKIV